MTRITLVQAILADGEAVSVVLDDQGTMNGLGNRLIERVLDGRCADVVVYRLFPPSAPSGPGATHSVDVRLLPGGEGSR